MPSGPSRLRSWTKGWAGTSCDVGPMVMVGEGAYEGLTAIVAFPDDWAGDDCTVSGYIIEGSIPAPPVPQTGE
mgnify:CR=1 FL=1